MNDFRNASLQAWSSVGEDWGELIDNIDRQLGAAAEWMIEAVALSPGDRVLELAGGPGTVSLMAARAVGEDGKVICTDFAEAMVQQARRRIDGAGVGNVETRVMDAESIELPDGSVDVVLCRMGYMLMADPGTALRESARVLSGGGRLALAVWSDADENPWASVPMRAVMQHLGAPAPPADAPGLWALADPERLSGLLVDAGFGSIRTEFLDDHVEYESPEQWLELTSRLAGPLRALFANMEPAGRKAIGDRVAEQADSYRTDGGSLTVPERMVVASARKE